MAHLSADISASFRFFAFFLANGTLELDLLEDFDYRPNLFGNPSGLEQVFAIFCNVLEVDNGGRAVLDDGTASYRAAQWIRQCEDPAYVVQPPFEQWELELHI
ncbi:hypothetical protein [Streptomyces sp. SID11385]|uniref:DUF7677 family protein n=1 Tax=Streptomyces sp. SID11385 TaxID=2706031 RepID=UPI0013C7B4CC|nr:hypothetical protein [Streptomyces sp. SID11385]NEA39522.1 hypothetical protein [Streptomyces sp. SID11385]